MQNSFNLSSAAAAIRQRWKTILFFVLVSMAVAAITVFVVPQYFKSAALVVSANPVLADKARLFNKQIQSLYSFFGSGDDLDRIYGIADMDTTYLKLVDEFSLISYYRLSNDSLRVLRRKAAKSLRKDISLQKTEKGQLQITAWTKDRQLSADLVTRMVAIIQETESDIWRNNYQLLYASLSKSLQNMELTYQALGDSLQKQSGATAALFSAKQNALLEQIVQYQKSADECRLAILTTPAVLYVMESASPAAKAERPDKPGIILAAGLLGLLFASLLVLVADRKNRA